MWSVPSKFHTVEGETVRRIALASIITATVIFASACSAQKSGPEEPATPPTSTLPGHVPITTEEPVAAELTKMQLVELCLTAPGVAPGVSYASPDDGRFERRVDGLWFVEINGEMATDAPGYTVCIIDNDTSEVLSSQTALESEPDPNNVYAYDSAAGGE